ncbi:hypothetical protein ACFZCK_30935 [Kitasatospora purpeofusca]|uniref:hypothetical protein n=1 Tax=Kitasatospora purpeofusca TaxID=67352 RepID=UPI0036E82D74
MFRTVTAKAAAVATFALVALAGAAATGQTAAQTTTTVEARPITVITTPAEDLIWG